jgi:GH15 family glucan-1,4-alpha-glucosidase
VRIGNGAYRQRQIDVYGEIMDWALLYQTLGGMFDADTKRIIAMLADVVADTWHEPDHGIWEMRGPNMHHVHGKVMSWVALDRAIRLVGPRERWVTERDRIAAEVAARGLDRSNAHLVQAYDSVHTDAALLLTPLAGFPIGEDVLRNTVEAVERELRAGDFVYRYRNEDGLAGGEGAFLICSFWLVDALIYLGREQEAQDLLGKLIAHENDVGLFSEEIEIADNAFLGNFPQAYTHLALVGSAIHLELFRKYGMAGIKGTHADRAQRVVSATLGWRALWAAFKATWRVGRILSSRRSMLTIDGD